MMDIKQIMDIIPHRPPFLLIDRVEEIVEGEKIVAIKNVTMNEPFFVGHYPGEPVMPGVLIIEAMAQAGAVAIQSKCGNRQVNSLCGRKKGGGSRAYVYDRLKNLGGR